jgi:serine/threonine-protein kinase
MASVACAACGGETSEFNVDCPDCGEALPESTLQGASAVERTPVLRPIGPASDTLRGGAVVADRFRLIEPLGRGGMGVVWRAHDQRLNVPCAVKFLLDEVVALADIRQRFEREAQAAAQLKSRHVVAILDHGIWKRRPYLAMELLEGEDLAARLARRDRLSPAETAAIVEQIARGLAKAHKAGIVHRDLKPDNVFLASEDEGEVVKILDFGIAKRTWPDATAGVSSTGGGLIGTPSYMSPEQASGKNVVDYRTDLWSVAVIAFRCITGRLPFQSTAIGELLVSILSDRIPMPSEVAQGIPASFDRWWAKAAARKREDRFASAPEMAEALKSAVGGGDVVVTVIRPSAGPLPHDMERAATLARSAVSSASATPRAAGRFTGVVAGVAAVAAVVAVVAVVARQRISSPPANEAASAADQAASHVVAAPKSVSDGPVVAPAPEAVEPAPIATSEPSIEARPVASVAPRAAMPASGTKPRATPTTPATAATAAAAAPAKPPVSGGVDRSLLDQRD